MIHDVNSRVARTGVPPFVQAPTRACRSSASTSHQGSGASHRSECQLPLPPAYVGYLFRDTYVKLTTCGMHTWDTYVKLTTCGMLRAQLVEVGTVCLPAYNCKSDWTVCVQLGHEPAAVAYDPASTCQQISELSPGGNSGRQPPVGGWQPTAIGGWMKGTGDLACGWGATYARPTHAARAHCPCR